jgi:hypothetical protein
MSESPDIAKLKALQKSRMTSWYSPFQLARSAVDIAVSGLLGGRGDFRLLEAVMGPQPPFDYSELNGAPRDELWLDYVADVGDGFNPTYAIASLLARPELVIEGRRTRRGEVLIMGGDQVYPSATREAYWRRLVEPYSAALPKSEVDEAPDLFAIPGNHDWYDGLVSFMRLFCQQRTIGAWKTRQSRSYFALKLPHGFWVLGVDIQLEADLDEPQIEYFCEIARNRMKDGDRIVLCTAEPDWVTGAVYNPDLQSNLAFLEKRIAKARSGVEIVGRIAGDLHHYRRHESDGGYQNITAGGGGAFLHPTHGEPVDKVHSGHGELRAAYFLKKSFPSERESRLLTWRNLLFVGYNLGFWPVSAFIYALTSLMLMQRGPSAVAWILVVLAVFIGFTDTHRPWYRVLGGLTHGSAHLAAAAGLTWLGFATVGIDLANPDSMFTVVGVMLFVAATAVVVGPTLMGLYLLLSLNGCRRHANEAFSALKIQDYKHFLRLHIDREGLTIYPIGLRKVPRAWKLAEARKHGEPLYVPAKEALKPDLIEEPFAMPNQGARGAARKQKAA